MTDDQTAASLAVMDNVRSELGAQGVTFNNSFVNFPACCPSRATFLTGQYAHNHGILGNRPPEGGFEKFNAMHGGNMLADWLQGGGYYTAHIGKYLNGYGEVDPALVPEGWNEWYAGVGEADAQEFYDYLLNENGSLVGYGSAPQDYKGDVITGKAVEFIGRRAPASEPFFLSVAYNAPHVGEPYPPGDPCVNAARPAPRHAGAFADEPLPRPPSFYEEDVSDKPRFIRVKDPLSGGLLAWTTRTYRCNLESLLSVDEGVGEIVAALRDSGELGDTYVIFTSDNGYFYGEHRIRTGKVFVYEESIRVPLLIRGPGVPPGQTVSKLVTNADLAPTVLDAAGVQPDLVQDGQSLLGSIAGRLLLVENPTYATYTAVRTPRYLYVEHTTGERELYDLEADPYQLQSLHENPAYRVVMAWMAQRLGELRGCAGASCLDSAGSACTILGSSGDDVLTGTPGDDVICSLGGNDVLEGAGGNDLLRGGHGIDRLFGDADVDALQGEAGRDTLAGGGGSDTLQGAAGSDTLAGDDDDDALDGGMGTDVLQGGTGADTADYATRTAPLTVSIGDGPDDGEAGEGDDVQGDVEHVTGGTAGDTLIGSGAANRLTGGAGTDALAAGAGDDVLDGGFDADVLQGGAGADTAGYATRTAPLTVSIGDGPGDGEASEGDDVQGDVEHVTGGIAGDTLIGSDAPNRMAGGPGNDSLHGEAGTDALEGGGGKDDLDGGQDADVVQGGASSDTADYTSRTAPLTVTIGAGPDDGERGEGDDVQGDVEHVTGGTAGDTLIGSGAANRLTGGAGTDALAGGGGNDALGGGPDADVMQGGGGSDNADYGSRTAPLTVSIGDGPGDGEAGEGDDVQGDVEHVTGGTAGDTLIGSGAANRLTGGAGTDALGGGGGNDALDGGMGADVLQGGTGADTADYASRTAPLTVSIGDGPGDGEAGEGDDVQGDVERVTGGIAGDTLIGSDASNRMAGGAGGDALTGGAGNDTLLGDVGDDALDARDSPAFTDGLLCGPGTDIHFEDPADSLTDCE